MENQPYLEEYYAGNGKKLRGVVDKILFKFGGITQKDMDDFYSLANEVFTGVLNRFDHNQRFDGFLYSCLDKKIKTEMTRRNRAKRQADQSSVSLHTPVGDGEITLGETLVSAFDLDLVMECDNGLCENTDIENYFKSLSKLQQKIIELKIKGMPRNCILKKLDISGRVYDKNFEVIRSFEKTKVLRKSGIRACRHKGGAAVTVTAQTAEKDKVERYSIYSLIEKVEDGDIDPNHPLQRQSGQWKTIRRDNLIATVLNDYKIPEIILAEQSKPYGVVNYLIDGKQRITYFANYKSGNFKLGRNIEKPMVKYQAVQTDEDGNPQLDREGHKKFTAREFDIRGKFYDDLPKELKKLFNNFNITVTQFLNCTDDEIEYHIRRYNSGQQMSAAQNGITHIGEDCARVAKAISEHSFFKDCGHYSMAVFSKGVVDRVVVESVMVINFLSDWKKKQEDICGYLKVHAKINHFNKLESELDRLTEVVTREAAGMFNSKDSFLWFGLFDRYTESGLTDERFIQFMEAFKETLHCKAVNGITYDDLSQKSTKDKRVVIQKLDFMEALMNEYFHIDKKQKADRFTVKNTEMKEYIREFLNTDIVQFIGLEPETEGIRTAMQTLMIVDGDWEPSDEKIQQLLLGERLPMDAMEDTLLFLASLNDWSLGVDNNSEIFAKEHLPVLVQLISYTYKNDLDEEPAIRWFDGYVKDFKVNGGFVNGDLRGNYKKMETSLKRFAAYEQKRNRIPTPGRN